MCVGLLYENTSDYDYYFSCLRRRFGMDGIVVDGVVVVVVEVGRLLLGVAVGD